MFFGYQAFIGAGLIAFGDSFTVGQGATDAPHQYAIRLNSYIGGTLNNQAISGTGTSVAAQKACAILPNNRKSAVSVLAGYNDIGRYGASAYFQISNNLRSIITCSLLKESLPASNLRRFGIWNALGANYGGRAFFLGGTGLYTDDANAYLEWDFYGETLVVGSYATSPASYSNVKVSIDGADPQVLQNIGIQSNEAFAYTVLVLKNLGFGKHTVRLFVDDANHHTTIDYVGTLVNPKMAQVILIGEIPIRTLWTYNGVTIDQSIINSANVIIEATINEFSEWPVSLVPTSQFYKTTDVGPDGLHPNDTGHLHLFEAFKSQLSLHY